MTVLGVVLSIVDLIKIYYASNGAIAQAKQSKLYQRFKHILRWFHLIKDKDGIGSGKEQIP